MKNINNIIWMVFLSLSLVGMFSCTKLEYELTNELSAEDAQAFFDENGIGELIESTYISSKDAYQGLQTIWHLEEWSGDQIMTPTRGGDWGDGGNWITLHTHTWNADHPDIRDAFKKILQVVFKTTEVLNTNPEPVKAAEMRFLRAFAVGTVANLWGQVPIRVDFDNLLSAPPVMTAEEATQFAIEELNAVIPDLPDGPVDQANKDAGKAYLMHILLNKGAFITPETPTFAPTDMDRIIELADEIIGTGKYNIDCNIFDNFLSNNNITSCENIWTFENVRGDPTALALNRHWLATLNSAQGPGGWNGFATLSDFYDSFEPEDERLYYEEPNNFNTYGMNLGILTGEQTDKNGRLLVDGDVPVIYTPDMDLVMTAPIEKVRMSGYRILKYNVDTRNPDNPDNDLVMLRYAHVLFMKAEALFRKGDVPGATSIINQVRNERGLTDLTTPLDEAQLLEEWGHEFYLESRRRTDLIRFGKFLEPFQLKPNTDNPKYLKFAIPSAQVTANENLQQNPGY